ncbi:MAG: PEP-CTERM sorting domain-containing protein [Rubrivivax sp.]
MIAGHVYQVVVDESGTAIEAAAFDGIDPSFISLSLSPGLRVDTSNGIAPPTFLALTLAPVPEPSTFVLLGLGMAVLKLRRRRPIRAVEPSV